MQKKLLDGIPKEPRRLRDNIAVWAEFFELAAKYKAVSLGQGAPDLAPPKFL